MKARNQWLLRLPSLLLILAILAAYQVQVKRWQQRSEENQRAISEVEAYNAEILALRAQTEAVQKQGTDPAVRQRYADGSYRASATGFGGPIELRVTLQKDEITEITVLSHDGEDAVYFQEATEIIDRILDVQSVKVDTVSGATFSSKGILEAVSAALRQAEEAA